MEAATRIALLLLGLGVGGARGEEASSEEKSLSPIFVVPVAKEPDLVVVNPPERTAMSHQLAALLRHEASLAAANITGGTAPETVAPEDAALQLEKMTVQAKKILPLPAPRESPLEKFTRTGHLWEFTDTKRFMIGPRGDKVGLMFSFDW